MQPPAPTPTTGHQQQELLASVAGKASASDHLQLQALRLKVGQESVHSHRARSAIVAFLDESLPQKCQKRIQSDYSTILP